MARLRTLGIPIYRGCGVYAITCRVNGKSYVGSALAVRGRVTNHRSCLRRGKHDNLYLQRSWAKYGEDKFSFDLLEECIPEEVIDRENFWIVSLKTLDSRFGYNLRPAGLPPMTGRKHTEESRAKMARSQKAHGKMVKIQRLATEAAAIANRGVPRSTEVREKISAAQKGKKKSPEHSIAVKKAHWSKHPDAAEIAEKSASKNRGKLRSTCPRRKKIWLLKYRPEATTA